MLKTFSSQKQDVLKVNKEINRAVASFFGGMAQDLKLLVYASGDLTDVRTRRTFLSRSNIIIQTKFLGSDARNAYAPDGTTPLSEYALLINKVMAFGAQVAITPHVQLLSQLPTGLLMLQQSAVRRAVSQLREQVPTPSIPHTEVLPSGYTLNDSIWNLSSRTSGNFTRMITDAILSGKSPAELANRIDAYLLPGRSGIRTRRPYGRNVSYDAMRLARTEAMTIYNRISLEAIRSNPMIDFYDIARSGAGDPECTICPNFVTIDMGGGRVAPPFSSGSTPPTPPYHPHCMCYVLPSMELADVDISELIGEIEYDDDELYPVDDSWIALVLGAWILKYLREVDV